MTVLTRPRATRRRRPPLRQKASRMAVFGPGPLLGAGGWAFLDCPLHQAGLAIMAVLGLAAWPLLAVTVLFAPSCKMVLVPRRWRRKYRNRDDHWYWRNRGRAQARSEKIPVFLRRVVWAADRYRCVVCGQAGDIAVDHWCPWILGGLTVLPNLMTLCSRHNTVKSFYWRDRNGYEHYRGGGLGLQRAREITAIERRARRDPRRWYRAAWALGA